MKEGGQRVLSKWNTKKQRTLQSSADFQSLKSKQIPKSETRVTRNSSWHAFRIPGTMRIVVRELNVLCNLPWEAFLIPDFNTIPNQSAFQVTMSETTKSNHDWRPQECKKETYSPQQMWSQTFLPKILAFLHSINPTSGKNTTLWLGQS